MWSAVLSAVVGVHVVAALVAVVFWPYLRKIKDVPWCQRIYGAVRCRLQALTAPLYDPWDAHHIVDNVYLGNLASACNLPRMRDLKVRRVVSVMIGAQEVFPSHFDYHVVHVRDLPEENLLRHLAETTAVISAAVARGEVVYVHCAAGKPRWEMCCSFPSYFLYCRRFPKCHRRVRVADAVARIHRGAGNRVPAGEKGRDSAKCGIRRAAARVWGDAQIMGAW